MKSLCRKWSLLVEIRFVFSSVVWLVSVKLYFKNFKIQIFANQKHWTFLTARSSSGVKSLSNCFLIGTIMIKKNGKARLNCDDLTVQSMAKAQTCTNVKMCIFHVGTLRTNGAVPWCFTGMKKSRKLNEFMRNFAFITTYNKSYRSKNCTPIIEQIPMYKKTPKSTDIGICFSKGDAKIDKPTNNETKKPDKRCETKYDK